MEQTIKMPFSQLVFAFEKYLKCQTKICMKMFHLTAAKQLWKSAEKPQHKNASRGDAALSVPIGVVAAAFVVAVCIWQARFDDCHRYGCTLCRLSLSGAANQPPEMPIANWAPFHRQQQQQRATKNLIVCFHFAYEASVLRARGQRVNG